MSNDIFFNIFDTDAGVASGDSRESSQSSNGHEAHENVFKLINKIAVDKIVGLGFSFFFFVFL